MRASRSILKDSRHISEASRTKSAKKIQNSPVVKTSTAKSKTKPKSKITKLKQSAVNNSTSKVEDETIRSKINEILNDEKSELGRSIRSSRCGSMIDNDSIQLDETQDPSILRSTMLVSRAFSKEAAHQMQQNYRSQSEDLKIKIAEIKRQNQELEDRIVRSQSLQRQTERQENAHLRDQSATFALDNAQGATQEIEQRVKDQTYHESPHVQLPGKSIVVDATIQPKSSQEQQAPHQGLNVTELGVQSRIGPSGAVQRVAPAAIRDETQLAHNQEYSVAQTAGLDRQSQNITVQPDNGREMAGSQPWHHKYQEIQQRKAELEQIEQEYITQQAKRQIKAEKKVHKMLKQSQNDRGYQIAQQAINKAQDTMQQSLTNSQVDSYNVPIQQTFQQRVAFQNKVQEQVYEPARSASNIIQNTQQHSPMMASHGQQTGSPIPRRQPAGMSGNASSTGNFTRSQLVTEPVRAVPQCQPAQNNIFMQKAFDGRFGGQDPQQAIAPQGQQPLFGVPSQQWPQVAGATQAQPPVRASPTEQEFNMQQFRLYNNVGQDGRAMNQLQNHLSTGPMTFNNTAYGNDAVAYQPFQPQAHSLVSQPNALVHNTQAQFSGLVTNPAPMLAPQPLMQPQRNQPFPSQTFRTMLVPNQLQACDFSKFDGLPGQKQSQIVATLQQKEAFQVNKQVIDLVFGHNPVNATVFRQTKLGSKILELIQNYDLYNLKIMFIEMLMSSRVSGECQCIYEAYLQLVNKK